MNPLKFIDQIKDMYNDQDPGSTIPGPRNMQLAKAYDVPDAFHPELEQTEVLRPGETLEDWEPNPFLKPHAEGGRAGYNDGQLVTPNVDGSRPGYAGRPPGSPQIGGKQIHWTTERKVNLKNWMDNTGSTLKDYKKASPSKQWGIREGKTTGIKQTQEYGKTVEDPKTKKFRTWLSNQDPAKLKTNSYQELIKKSGINVNRNRVSSIMSEPENKKFINVKKWDESTLFDKPKTKSLGNGIYEITSVRGNKSYYGKVTRESEVLKSPSGTLAEAQKFVKEKRKIPKAKSVVELQQERGLLLDQPEYKKALGDALDDLAKMEKKGYGAISEIVKKYKKKFSRIGEKTIQGKIIEKGVTTESVAITNAIRSYAAENNIRDVQIKEMEKGLDDYRTKKIVKRGDIPKLMKKYGISEVNFNSWLIELDARRKIPLKYKNESERIKVTRAKRAAALKKYSSGAFERWTKGTAESGLHGGHTGQIYSEEVTPKTKKFTPAKINQETLKEFDAILQGIADKRDKAFKAKNWAEVERLNQKGMEYASATEGYKTFTIKNKDGTTFEWGVTKKGAVDPMDLTKEGITAKEMESWRMGKNPEVTRAKSKLEKIKNTHGVNSLEYRTALSNLEKINAAEAAKLFAEGKNKALLDFQKSEAMQSAKMSKKEITALDKRLRENLIKLCPKGKASGGRIGFSTGTATVACGVSEFNKLLKQGKGNNPLVKKILQGGGNILKAGAQLLNPAQLLKLRNLLGPEALGFFAAYEAGVITDDVLRKGTPLNEALSKNWLTKSFVPYTEEFAKQKNLLQSGQLDTDSKRIYALDMMKTEKAWKEMDRIEGMEANQLVEDTLGDDFKFTSQEDIDAAKANVARIVKDLESGDSWSNTGKEMENIAAMDEMIASRPEKFKYFLQGDRGTPLTNKLARPSGKRMGPMTAKREMKIDFSLPTYDRANVTEQDVLDMYKREDVISPMDHKSGRKLYPGELTWWKMQNPGRGIYGTQDKFADGGITNLKIKW